MPRATQFHSSRRRGIRALSSALGRSARLALLALTTLVTLATASQRLPAQAAASSASAPPIAPDLYRQLHWRTIGPEGNRFTSAAGIPGDPLTYYVGAASGGVWKTVDGGVNWQSIFDEQPVQSIGALAIARSDPNVVWAGTGEAHIRSHISIGQGVYKSTDAGRQWTLMGLEQTGRIARIAIDPRDPNTVLVCALGHAYGPQPERGVFRTTDGGATWTRVLHVDENTGCSDLAMDPTNSRILFAGMWQFEIHTWGRTSGGPGSGLFTSRDGGVTWKRLSGNGLPRGPVGKVAVGIAPSNPDRIFAMIETGDGIPWDGQPTENGQLWRSDDGGTQWALINRDRNVMGRAHYYSRMMVAPDDADEAYFLTASYARTIDGGTNVTIVPRGKAPGGDHHDIWIDPGNADRQIVAHDQGLSITQNRGRSWFRQRLANAQIYHVTVDNEIPYNVLGNKQDEPSYRGPSNSRVQGFGGDGGIPRGMWHSVGGGESGWATPDPTNSKLIWSTASGSGMVGGIVVRFEEDRRQFRNVEVWPQQSNGPASGVKYRFVWDAPLLISPHDHNTIYIGSQHVHRTTDGGQSWQVISPDLTLNDKSRHGELGRVDPRQHRRGVRRRGLRDRRVAAREGDHLGRDKRRAGPTHARQRRHLDQPDEEPPQPARVGLGAQHRRLALRCGDGVPHGRLPPGEQPRSVHLSHNRLREDVEEHHRRNPAQHAELRAHHHRGPQAARHAVRRHGERHLCVVQRWRAMAAAAERPAARPALRDRGAGTLRRPGDLHLRAWLLDPRRPERAPGDDARGDRAPGHPVHAARGLPVPPHHRTVHHLRRPDHR
ncbi:MAG: hypothetical protein IPF98_15880 [Gemmatimonadetes bacterium]|nr:hypothetical protein [Gemmatimonadota bacterium]